MVGQYPLGALLRPAVELYTTTVCFIVIALCIVAPQTFALTLLFGIVATLGSAWLGIVRLKQAGVVLRYRWNIRRLPKYTTTSAEMPVSNEHLFIGRGPPWTQKHTQHLADTYLSQLAPYVEPPSLYERARRLEKQLEFAPFPLKLVAKATVWDMIWNPARLLPSVGGLPRLHGIEPHKQDMGLQLGERVSHALVLGITRVGKTRLAELSITQDTRRIRCRGRCRRAKMGRRTQTVHHGHRRRCVEEQPNCEVVVVFDPKDDADLPERMYVECERVSRPDEFYVFHLGHFGPSIRYNAVGRFGRIFEVATCVVGQLSDESNSVAFRKPIWRFVNIIARTLHTLGIRPDYQQIPWHVVNIDALLVGYAQKYISEHDSRVWDIVIHIEDKLNDKNVPFSVKGRPFRVAAIYQYLTQKHIADPVMEGPKSAVCYDKTHFDKIVASLLPLLRRFTTGRILELLSSNYAGLNDPRPIFDWMQVIRKRAVVYAGLDVLSDIEIATAVGSSMFSNLVLVAGHIYKHGADDGLPGSLAGGKVRTNLHVDEFNGLIGGELISMVNRASGAGVQVAACTQTMSDIEAKIGSRAEAGQIIGNLNNLFMSRVCETATAELLTNQLPKVQIYTSTSTSGANDAIDSKRTAFAPSSHDQVQMTSVPMLEPARIVGLPKGQVFALFEGGNLWEIRMPLPAVDPDEVVPKSLQELAAGMCKGQAVNSERQEAPRYSALQGGLPQSLVGDSRHLGTGEDAAQWSKSLNVQSNNKRARRLLPASSSVRPSNFSA